MIWVPPHLLLPPRLYTLHCVATKWTYLVPGLLFCLLVVRTVIGFREQRKDRHLSSCSSSKIWNCLNHGLEKYDEVSSAHTTSINLDKTFSPHKIKMMSLRNSGKILTFRAKLFRFLPDSSIQAYFVDKLLPSKVPGWWLLLFRGLCLLIKVESAKT